MQMSLKSKIRYRDIHVLIILILAIQKFLNGRIKPSESPVFCGKREVNRVICPRSCDVEPRIKHIDAGDNSI